MRSTNGRLAYGTKGNPQSNLLQETYATKVATNEWEALVSIAKESREKPVTAVANLVTHSIRSGSALKSDSHHSFPDIVDNYAGYATGFELVGGDGVKRILLQLAGSLNGVVGIFEWVVDPNPHTGVTHRRFIPDGKITGRPNQRGRRG